jgi:hypothetical protein
MLKYKGLEKETAVGFIIRFIGNDNFKNNNMKIVLYFITGILVLLILGKYTIWILFDEPIQRKSVLYLLFILCVLIWRNKWTFFGAIFLFILPFPFCVINSRYSGLGAFDFTNNLYFHFRDSYPGFAQFLLRLPLYFYLFMIALFCLPFTWKVYGLRKKKPVVVI